MEVKAWKEIVVIPTYKVGEEDKNPMFLENRVYQGSSGVVYPHPVIDKVYDVKENKEWVALFLENEYLKIMILPELGGRIQMAYDKTNNYHFIYYNQVIKPALVSLAGPWISGGIEFNWPQHHRPSTFEPVDFSIEENKDGSKTVWVNEYEKMFRTKCALGFTLHPGKAVIELNAKLFNRTPFPQTFLWWANPAVAVDEHYQSVFPPDVHAVFDHGKRDVSSFPIAKGTYYKVDYSPGTDISVYTNIPVPTSYMAVDSEFNFVGGYHHGKKAGMLHVANHHVSPGKKQWTWGCGEFGKAWDRHLTDDDGPYFELMCGMFTDNQPDFSWIMPNEVREFKQFFMPYKEIGYVKNATTDAVVNFEVHNQKIYAGVYVTEQKLVTIRLKKSDEIIFSVQKELTPTVPFSEELNIAVDLNNLEKYTLEVLDETGNCLVSYTPVKRKEEAMPDPAKPIAEPSQIKTNEELYLAGLHLEQYRHATYKPEDYYNEALRRDPSDSRCNNALGLLYLRRGLFQQSEKYLRFAVEKLLKHNPNPYDGEPLYNLGLSLKFQSKNAEAYKLFYKSTWNAAMQDNAFLQLAQIDCMNADWTTALEHIENSLKRNNCSPRARHLKAVLLQKLNRLEEAVNWCRASLQIDMFDYGSRYELYKALLRLNNAEKAAVEYSVLKALMRNNSHSYIEISLDYSHAGLFEEAFNFLLPLAESKQDAIVFYYLGYYKYRQNKMEECVAWFTKGFNCSPDKVFPNRIEDVEVLKTVVEVHKTDYKAFYYIGNFCYAKKRYEDAKLYWENSVNIYPGFATTHRNLGIAYYNKFNEKAKALESFKKAFNYDKGDARILFELDQLYKRFQTKPDDRLTFLQQFQSLVNERDDLYAEMVLLHMLSGKEKEAKEMLCKRTFHPWEGGEGKVSALHVQLCLEEAKESLQQGNARRAIELLKEAQHYPGNLGEGKLYGAQENDIFYWLGCAYEKLGNTEAAFEYWEKASVGNSEPSQAIFYNDQQPDKIFYQGAALIKLGKKDDAKVRFRKLIEYGLKNLDKEIRMDFFAVSLPDLMIFDDDLNKRNNIHCNYLVGLGNLGLGNDDTAKLYFEKVLEADPSHVGVYVHQKLLLNKI